MAIWCAGGEGEGGDGGREGEGLGEEEDGGGLGKHCGMSEDWLLQKWFSCWMVI